MQFGFFTAALADRPIEEVAHQAARMGFQTLELDVSKHIGDLAHTNRIVEAVRREGVDVCCLTCGPALMNADKDAQARTRATAQAAVEAALEAGVELVCTFPGRDVSLSEEDNYKELAAYYGPLLERAAQGNVRVIIENWPGPRVDFLATTPAGWSRLFSLVAASNLGLNLDPSHLIWQGIDHEQALRDYADRVFLAHAKDTEIFADRLQQVGYFGRGWWTYRLPGRGRIDWSQWLGLLRNVGFDGVVSIEHEDPDYGMWGGPAERRWEGLRDALRVLQTSAPAS